MAEESESRTEVLLGDLRVTSLMERLPPNVFPVSAGLTMQRRTANDNTIMEYSPPEYPAPIREPQGAYIPNTTVYFDNPAEIASSSNKTWPFHRFVEAFKEQIAEVDTLPADADERIYLTRLQVVEIPPTYVTTEEGRPAASPRLYANEGDMTIGYFNKYTELSIRGLREELGDALPGEINKPLRLTRIDEVTAKQHSGAVKQSKRRYYTEGQASATDDLTRVPKRWAAQEQAPVEDTRPLRVALDEIEEFFPGLSDAEFFRRVRFYGDEESKQRFIATDVDLLDNI